MNTGWGSMRSASRLARSSRATLCDRALGNKVAPRTVESSILNGIFLSLNSPGARLLRRRGSGRLQDLRHMGHELAGLPRLLPFVAVAEVDALGLEALGKERGHGPDFALHQGKEHADFPLSPGAEAVVGDLVDRAVIQRRRDVRLHPVGKDEARVLRG